jgi:serine/threonine protein kinase
VKALTRHSEQKKLMPQTQVLKIFAEVCEAVAHMHNQNPPIAHRDLKVRTTRQHSSLLCAITLHGRASCWTRTHSRERSS